MPAISEDKFPALFKAADNLSKSSQIRYIRMNALNIFLLIAFSISGSVSLGSGEDKKNLYVASSILIVLSMLVTYLIQSSKPDKDWYDGRAVAESVKTQTWRFIMASEPYDIQLSQHEARGKFLDVLQNIKLGRSSLISKLDSQIASGTSITQEMLEIRQMPFTDRKAIYLKDRIENQRAWYANKSNDNKLKSRNWFNIIFLCQGFVFLVAIFSDRWFDNPVNINGVISTAASSALAWLQLKRYQEIANSYNLAAQELAKVAEEGNNIHNETEFSTFVSNSENAISREHTMWVARRDS